MPDQVFPSVVTDATGTKWDVNADGQLVMPYVPVEYPKWVSNADGHRTIVQNAAEEAAHCAPKKAEKHDAHDHKAEPKHKTEHEAHDAKHEAKKAR